MSGRRVFQRRKGEPTIALINVVFLMLVFFLIAGTLAPPLDPSLTLVRTADLEAAPPPDALVIRADGSLLWQGRTVTAEAFAQGMLEAAPDAPLRIVPDRAAAAEAVIGTAAALRAAGAEEIRLVTERGME